MKFLKHWRYVVMTWSICDDYCRSILNPSKVTLSRIGDTNKERQSSFGVTKELIKVFVTSVVRNLRMRPIFRSFRKKVDLQTVLTCFFHVHMRSKESAKVSNMGFSSLSQFLQPYWKHFQHTWDCVLRRTTSLLSCQRLVLTCWHSSRQWFQSDNINAP